jgi:predicted amidohydrolase
VYSKIALAPSNPLSKFGALRRPAEREIFTRGTTDGVLEWGGVRVGALICADGGFPNSYRQRQKKGVQLFCHPSASAGRKGQNNNPTPETVAHRYGRPVIFANVYRPTFIHEGNSQICDAEGNVITSVGAMPDVVIDAEVTLPPVTAGAVD